MAFPSSGKKQSVKNKSVLKINLARAEHERPLKCAWLGKRKSKRVTRLQEVWNTKRMAHVLVQ